MVEDATRTEPEVPKPNTTPSPGEELTQQTPELTPDTPEPTNPDPDPDA